MIPRLTFENRIFTFILMRDGKEVVCHFKDSFVVVSLGNEKSIPASHLARMNGPSYNGWTYHIYAQHNYEDRDSDESFIWLSKEEFDILSPIYEDLREKDFYETHVCSYCKYVGCTEDHGYEMGY